MSLNASVNSKILARALASGRRRAMSYCKSESLREGMYTRMDVDTTALASGVVRTPHYWAKYYHDGRGAARSPKGGVLVWYRNWKDDPRLPSKRPLHRGQVQKGGIPRAKFLQDKRSGKLIVKKVSGPTIQPQNPYFSNDAGMMGLMGDVHAAAKAEMRQMVIGKFKSAGFLHKKIRRTLNV